MKTTETTYSPEQRLSAAIFGITAAQAAAQFHERIVREQQTFTPTAAAAAAADARFKAAFPNANR